MWVRLPITAWQPPSPPPPYRIFFTAVARERRERRRRHSPVASRIAASDSCGPCSRCVVVVVVVRESSASRARVREIARLKSNGRTVSSLRSLSPLGNRFVFIFFLNILFSAPEPSEFLFFFFTTSRPYRSYGPLSRPSPIGLRPSCVARRSALGPRETVLPRRSARLPRIPGVSYRRVPSAIVQRVGRIAAVAPRYLRRGVRARFM